MPPTEGSSRSEMPGTSDHRKPAGIQSRGRHGSDSQRGRLLGADLNAIPPPGVPLLGRPTLVGSYFGPQGFGLVEPSSFSFGTEFWCQGIEWGSWGSPEAVGTGLAGYVAPGEFGYQATLQTATVVAFDLGNCGGQLMYQAIEWYFPEDGGSFNPSRSLNICSGD